MRIRTTVEKIALLLLVAALAARATQALNADSLWIDRTIRYFLKNGDVRGCAIQPAPNVFPDAVLYFPLRVLLGNAHRAHAAFAAILAWLWAWKWTAFRRETAREYSYTPAIIGLALLLAISSWERGFISVLLPGHHGGTAVSTFFIATSVASKASWRPWTLGLVITSALATAMSDRAAAPWAGALLAPVLFGRLRDFPARRLFALALPFAIASRLAAWAENGLGVASAPSHAVPNVGLEKLGLWYLLDGWRRLFVGARAVAIVSIVFEAAVVVAVLLFVRAGAARLPDRVHHAMIGAGILGPLVAVAAIPHDQPGFTFNATALRYLGLPTFLGAMAVGEALAGVRRSSLLVAAVLAQVAVVTPRPPRLLPLAFPMTDPLARCVADLGARGYRTVIGEYWTIWRLEAIGGAGMTFWASDGGDTPYAWLSPYAMPASLHVSRATKFAVAARGLDLRRVEEAFEPANGTLQCGGETFLLFH